ncbi:MAG: chitobiase/beta-hexosaminidase C-terminal domain-containing protein [Lachnospiraceae bacterium]|nr:chitobiase/beta-hexosaminidase C-terminal domain-containing protein [Lachnospiraceae bacterium]
MKKQVKRIIARIMVVLMILSVLPLDAIGMGGAVAKATAGDFHEHNFTDESGNFITCSGFFTTDASEKSGAPDKTPYKKAIKLSTGKSISFEAGAGGTLTMFLVNCTTIKINSKAINVTGENMTFEVGAGTCKIEKGSGEAYVYYISFTESEGDGTPKAPTATPASGSEVLADATVELNCETAGAEIRYTNDGSEPSESSTLYEGAFAINPPRTIKAIAVKDTKKSTTATFTYTLKEATLENPITFTAPATNSAVPKGTEITLTAANGGKIRYTTDGTNPADTNQEYSDSVTITINDTIIKDNTVTIKAVEILDGVSSELLTLTYTIAFVPTPTATPSAGSIVAGSTVTLKCTDADAEIHYTDNGDDPTAASPKYETPITINESKTIKAIAIRANYNDSQIATFKYTVRDEGSIVEHVLDADAIYAADNSAKKSFKEPTSYGADDYFTVMAAVHASDSTKDKGASLSKIADITSKGNPVYSDLNWSEVGTAREYAIAITGGKMDKNNDYVMAGKNPTGIINAIKFTTTAFATVDVYYSAKGDTDRTIGCKSGDNFSSSVTTNAVAGNKTKVKKTTFDIATPGTYYLGFEGGDGGIIPYMKVTEDLDHEIVKPPTPVVEKKIEVSDTTATIIGAELVGDVSFVKAADADKADAEEADVTNIVLKASKLEANDAAITNEIKTAVDAEVAKLTTVTTQTAEVKALDNGDAPKVYYFDLSLEDKDKDTDNALQLKSGAIKFKASYAKLDMESRDTLVVLHGKDLVDSRKVNKERTEGFTVEADSFSPYIFIVKKAPEAAEGEVDITHSYGYEEGACAEWKDYTVAGKNTGGYVAYVSRDKTFPDDKTKTWKIDNELIRKYDNYWRVDTVGLSAGTYYIKVDAVTIDEDKKPVEVIGSKITGPLTVTNYDRSGFAFSKNSPTKGDASGAYNEDGTLKAGAQIIYVTAETAKTCKATVNGTEVQGIQAILDAKEKKGAQDSILDIRIIGLVRRSDLDKISSSSEGLQIKGVSKENMNVTIEGIGEDAAVSGFGFMITQCRNVELRNFGVLNFMDDGVSIDNNNQSIWVHDLDLFYGSAGGDKDQAKGDGSIDIKNTYYCTVSYNHLWDSGKTSLIGGTKSDDSNYITFHHNWFDHSDSRHPRIRNASAVHIYNNYFDGNSKYGVGNALKASAFVEANYFRNCKYPMLISLQGSDAEGDGTFSGEQGGIIKAYGNTITGGNSKYSPYSIANTVEFDAYEVKNKTDKVPAEIKTKEAKVSYSNFDTDSSIMYNYHADTAAEARDKVIANAGRLNGGDLKWTFNNANEDTNYYVITELKDKVVNYQTPVKLIGGINGVVTKPGSGDIPVGESEYTITIDMNDGVTASKKITVPKGENVPTNDLPEAPTREGYIFDGWYNDDDVKIDVPYKPYKSGTLTAAWRAIRYFTVTINKGDGSDLETIQVKEGDAIPAEKLTAPSRTGFTFDGWKDGSGKTVDADYIPAGDVTINAQWLGDSGTKTYTIIIDADNDSQPITQIVAEGEKIPEKLLVAPTKEGYTFKGWKDLEGNTVDKDYVPTKSTTVKAQWQQNSQGPGNDEPGDEDAKPWSIKLKQSSYVYTGTAIKPELTVYGSDGHPLVEGVDYTVKYTNNIKASVKKDANGDYKVINEKKVPTVTITGKGILTSKDTATFEIKPKDISKALDETSPDTSVAVSNIIIETGKKATTPVVFYNGKKLGASDYNCITDKNKKYTAAGVFTIEGKNNFEGKLDIPVKAVTKAELKNAVKKFTVTVDSKKAKELIYTGTDKTMADIAKFITVKDSKKATITNTNNDKYIIVLPDGTKASGSVKFMVVGTGEYSGCIVTKSVKIQPRTITGKGEGDDKVTVTNDTESVYTAAGAALDNIVVKWKNNTLTRGKDYKISYSGNKKGGVSAKYTLTFMGNYKGKVTGNFNVKKGELKANDTSIKVEIADKVCKDNKACKSTPYVTIGDVLVKPSEYDVTYSVGDTKNYVKAPKVEFKTASSVTVYVKITAKENKNYTGLLSGESYKYTVWKQGTDKTKDLSKAKITFKDANDAKITKMEYTGKAVIPAKIVVSLGGKDYVVNTADTASVENAPYTYKVVNNVNKGKATVVIAAKSDSASGLIGGKSQNFTIVSRNIKNNRFENMTSKISGFFNGLFK